MVHHTISHWGIVDAGGRSVHMRLGAAGFDILILKVLSETASASGEPASASPGDLTCSYRAKTSHQVRKLDFVYR
jgi:hypothetical protein